MGINSDHLIGFLFGISASALGLHYYKKNKSLIDALIRDARAQAEPAMADAMEGLSIEELLLMKERLEDIIAEHEVDAAAVKPEEEAEEDEAEEAEEKPANSKKKATKKK